MDKYRRYYLKNRERVLARKKRQLAMDPERVRSIKRRAAAKFRATPYGKLMGRISSQARRARLALAVPPWLTRMHLDQISEIFALAHALSGETGVSHEVDHIVPLVSPVVCGLHVPWNLRAIPMKENRAKKNKLPEVLAS